MNAVSSPASHLIEPGAKHFLFRTLQKCHEVKTQYFSIWFNLIVFLAFSITVALILYFRYKGAPSNYEKRMKMMRDQQYVLSKIQYYHDEKKRASYTNIGDLPVNHPDYDIALRRMYGSGDFGVAKIPRTP